MRPFLTLFAQAVTIVSLVVACSGICTAVTIPIPLVNPGFEDPGLGTISNGFDVVNFDVPGWSNGTATYTDTGVEAVTAYSHTSDYAAKWFDGDAASAIQLTGHTIAAGDKFALTTWIRANILNSHFVLSLYYDVSGTRTPFASEDFLIGAGGPLVYSEYTLNGVAPSGAVGHQLGIELGTYNQGGVYSATDDIGLTVDAVPEPGTLVLLAAGLLSLLAYAWRKRK